MNTKYDNHYGLFKILYGMYYIIFKMPKRCIICKVEANVDPNRSYHMFPKNEILRQKWVDNLRLTDVPNFKTAQVCSDHFDKNSFYPYDPSRIRKRLCPEAVPKVRKFKLLDIPEKNVEKEIPLIDLDSSDENDELDDINVALNMYNEIDVCTDNESLKNSFEQVSEDSNFEVVNEEDLFTTFQFNDLLDNYSNNNKRKNIFSILSPRKKIRFTIDCNTEYLTRSDFVSDDAWNRFSKFLTYKNSKLAAAHNKNSRKEKKLKICLELITDLLSKEENCDA